MLDQSLTQLFFRGGTVMWPLLACSVVALAIALERTIVYFRLRESFRQLLSRLEPLVRSRKLAEARRELAGRNTPLAVVVAQYLDLLNVSDSLREEVVTRTASEQLSRLERRLSWLATIGHLAPMLGLLGTVTGLITAFHRIELAGGQVQPADLASGIWEALLTTVFGLVIALPAMAVYHALENRVGAIALELQWSVTYLNEWFGKQPGARTGAAGHAATTSAATETAGIGVGAG